MNMRAITIIAICVGEVPALGAAAAPEQKVPASAARISMPEARATALKAHPGRIKAAELEREKGGSGLRYSFDISNAGKTFEVGVDAKTGTVLENKAEDTNPD